MKSFRVLSICTLVLLVFFCLNFTDDNLVLAFSNPAISMVQRQSITRAIHGRQHSITSPLTLRKSRMPYQLRAKEVSAGAENGVALPLRNFQEESFWLQVIFDIARPPAYDWVNADNICRRRYGDG
jgi:hypothetical protein